MLKLLKLLKRMNATVFGQLLGLSARRAGQHLSGRAPQDSATIAQDSPALLPLWRSPRIKFHMT
jgi:hypothetical protein